jgi:hypothetical protein
MVMWTKKSRRVRIAGWEGCTSGKGIRCSSTVVSVPGFALDSGGIAATGAAAEVSADGAWGTVLALPSCAGSSVSSTIPFIILEVDATFNLEPLGGAGTTALRCVLRVVQWPLLGRKLPSGADASRLGPPVARGASCSSGAMVSLRTYTANSTAAVTESRLERRRHAE